MNHCKRYQVFCMQDDKILRHKDRSALEKIFTLNEEPYMHQNIVFNQIKFNTEICEYKRNTERSLRRVFEKFIENYKANS